MRRFSVGFVVALCVGCVGAATEPNVGEEFTLRVGEYAVVTDANLFVGFVGVDGDSRCPLQVQCVWAGDAAVVVETAPLPDPWAAPHQSDTLHTTLEPRSVQLGSVELVLIAVTPYPETPGSIEQNQYAVTFTLRAVP